MKDLNDNEISIWGKLRKLLLILTPIVVLVIAAQYGLFVLLNAFVGLASIALFTSFIPLIIKPSDVKPKISLDSKVEQDLDNELHDMLKKSKSIVKENTHMNQNEIVSVKEKDETIKHTYESSDEEFLIDELISTKEGPILSRKKY